MNSLKEAYDKFLVWPQLETTETPPRLQNCCLLYRVAEEPGFVLSKSVSLCLKCTGLWYLRLQDDTAEQITL